MISLFYSSSILLLRDRRLPVASQAPPRPPAPLVTLPASLASVIYQARSAGSPIKPSTPVTGVHILFTTAHLTKQGFAQSLTRSVCTAASRPAWEEKASSSYSACSSTSLLVWPQISYSALETPPFSKIKPCFTSGCVRTK